MLVILSWSFCCGRTLAALRWSRQLQIDAPATDCVEVICQEGTTCGIVNGFAKCKSSSEDVLDKYTYINGPTDCAEVTCEAGQTCKIRNGFAQCSGQTTEDSEIACPTDNKECPDGSFVGRDPYNDCDFKECSEVELKTVQEKAPLSGSGNLRNQKLYGRKVDENGNIINDELTSVFGQRNSGGASGFESASRGSFEASRLANHDTFKDAPRRPGNTMFAARMTKGCNGPVCSLPPESGPCKAAIGRYFYNSGTRQCEDFVYGGCEGNENSFSSSHDCEKTCGGCDSGSNNDPSIFEQGGW